MIINFANVNKLVGFDDFLSDALNLVTECGESPLLVLHENKPAFYVVPVKSWDLMGVRAKTQGGIEVGQPVLAQAPAPVLDKSQLISKSDSTRGLTHLATDQRSFEKKNNFNFIAEKLLDTEWERVGRGELSAASVGIQKNRLEAHVLPFFRYVAPTQVTHVDLDGFVSRLTQHQLSSTTVSQYLVLVRKLLKLAVRQGLLKEVPEFPRIKVITKPRSMLSLLEYRKLAHTALKMSRSGVQAPPLKSSDGHRDRFWVAPRNMLLAPDMFWVIRFMVNSFFRPGDLRQLKNKHVTVVRGESVYLRLNLPETKKHDKPIVTLQPAVFVYERLQAKQKADGYGKPDDYVFLPDLQDRKWLLVAYGWQFMYLQSLAGIEGNAANGQTRTIYSLRHTAMTFRLLYGGKIDLLTLARNARTSVEMIERFYASNLTAEMNIDLLQGKRS